MMKKNITMFIPSLGGGGAEKVAVNLANYLDKDKFKLTLLVLDSKASYSIHPDVKIKAVKSKRLISVIPELAHFMKKNPPDLFISHMNLTNVVTLLAKKIARGKFPVMVIEHSTSSNKYKDDSFGRRLIPSLMRLSYKSANSIVAVSEGVAKDLAQITRLSEKEINVIYNPIVHEQIYELASHSIEHPWLNNDNLKVVLGIGRLEKVKNFDLLIRAFSDIYKEDSSIRLLILGEGSERENLQNYVYDRGVSNVVSLPGFVKNPYSFLSKASVFVLSSKLEGLPTVLIEAMACGTPVVSTDCPSGPREILNNGQYGTLVPVGDHVKLGRAILEIIKGKQVYQSKELISRANDFSVNNAIKQYEELILSMLS